jgi:hypothetical protein
MSGLDALNTAQTLARYFSFIKVFGLSDGTEMSRISIWWKYKGINKKGIMVAMRTMAHDKSVFLDFSTTSYKPDPAFRAPS